MAKQPARLADFEIPRGEGQLTEAQTEIEGAAAPPEAEPPTPPPAQPAPEPEIVPMRIAPRPVAEARQAMTVRLPVSMHERIRVLMFTSRRSQQDIVEDALNAFLTANQT
jgi:hypothetical protein